MGWGHRLHWAVGDGVGGRDAGKTEKSHYSPRTALCGLMSRPVPQPISFIKVSFHLYYYAGQHIFFFYKSIFPPLLLCWAAHFLFLQKYLSTFIIMLSFLLNSQQLSQKERVFSPFYREGNQDLVRFRNSAKVTGLRKQLRQDLNQS